MHENSSIAWLLKIGIFHLLSLSMAWAGPLEVGDVARKQGNFREALSVLMPLAEEGNVKAQTIVGYMYGKGQGSSLDYSEEVKWYRRASEKGFATAQFNLGVMYERGRGVSQDYAQALQYYKLAADQNDGDGQNSLGSMYGRGLGVTQNWDEAARLYRLAAMNGNDAGQDNWGAVHALGRGVPHDFTRSYMGLTASAEAGYVEAKVMRAAIGFFLPEASIALAKQMLTDCRGRNFKGCY